MSGEKALIHIREIRKRRERAAEDRKELRRFCEEAKRAGVPITLIASEAGLSRQAVYDLLAEQPSA